MALRILGDPVQAEDAVQLEWYREGEILTWQYVTDPLCPWELPEREPEAVTVQGLPAQYWGSQVPEANTAFRLTGNLGCEDLLRMAEHVTLEKWEQRRAPAQAGVFVYLSLCRKERIYTGFYAYRAVTCPSWRLRRGKPRFFPLKWTGYSQAVVKICKSVQRIEKLLCNMTLE